MVLPDTSQDLLQAIGILSGQEGHVVETSTSADTGIERLFKDDKYDLVVAEFDNLDKDDQRDVIASANEVFTRVLLIGPAGTSARQFSPKVSVHGYMEMPFDADEFQEMIDDVIKHRPPRKKAKDPKEERGSAHAKKAVHQNQAFVRRPTKRPPPELVQKRKEEFEARADKAAAASGSRAGMGTGGGAWKATVEAGAGSSSGSGGRPPVPTSELGGTKMGEYQIVRKLGGGAMGVVFLARHEILQIDVAIKVLPPQLAGNQEYIDRFHREARSYAQLDHPNIVRVLGVGRHEDKHYIAMQFVNGPTLRQIMDTGVPMSQEVATEYMRQTVAGLGYAHKHDAIHRDIKPDNIMLNSEGVVKITDFGLVRHSTRGDPTLTRSGQVMGTPAFMPLEQWDAEDVDLRADLYAVGVTFYYLLSARLPYEGSVPSVILRKLVQNEGVGLHQRRQDLDPQLVGIVHKLIAREREDRYQDATDVEADLDAFRTRVLGSSAHMTYMPGADLITPGSTEPAREAPPPRAVRSVYESGSAMRTNPSMGGSVLTQVSHTDLRFPTPQIVTPSSDVEIPAHQSQPDPVTPIPFPNPLEGGDGS